MADQLDEIRSKIDLVQFLSEYLSIQKTGRNFKALCPFHSEKTPSFIISPERQIWKCFGCGKGGDVYGFLMEYERMDFGEALRLLAKRTGVVLKSYRPTEDEAKKTRLFEINHLAAEFFHYLLINHPAGKRALDYILTRGISKDSLKLFKIGYSPDLWDGLQKYLVGKKGYAAEDLEKAGLIIASQRPATDRRSLVTHYDRFRHRLIFPLVDHRDNVCGFAGRVIPTVEEREGQVTTQEARLPSPAPARLPSEARQPGDQAAGGQAKYVNTPETIVYHKSELLYPLDITKENIKQANQAIIVEGELDAISSFQAGIKNVVAIKGSALTEDQAKLLKRFTENLILALDTDLAGDNAARRGIETADKAGLNIRVVELEKYKDPDEAAQKDPKFYKECLKKAVPYYEYLINSAFRRYPAGNPEDKRKIGEEIVPVLAKIENEIIKSHYVRVFSDRLGVNEDAVLNQIKKVTVSGFVGKAVPVPAKAVRSRKELLEEHLLALYFQSGRTGELIGRKATFWQISAYQKVIELLKKDLEETKGKFKSEHFFSTLPPELREIFNNLYLVDFGGKIEDEAWTELELKKTETELEILKVKEELVIVSETIKKIECQDSVENKDLRQAREKFKNLSEELASFRKEKEV